MKHINHTALQMKELQPRIPAWAKLEKMEISTPEVVLWQLPDGPGKDTSIGFRSRMKCFFQRLHLKKPRKRS